MANRPTRDLLEEAKRAAGERDWPLAARLFKDLASAEPDIPANWHNLALAEMKAGLAVPMGPLRRAVLLRPCEPNYLNNLLVSAGGEARQKLLERLLVLDPAHVRALVDLAFLRRRAGRNSDSGRLARMAHLVEPGMPDGLARTVQALISAGDAGRARAVYHRYLLLDPEDRLGLGRDLARAGLLETDQAMSPSFVAGVFDGYAATFDTHLTDTLRYVGHEVLARMLRDLGVAKAARAVDLGCGSGLSGLELRRYAAHLTGVDLSERMLERARARGIYDALHRAEIVAWLEADSAVYDIAVAADVTSYLGDLGPFFLSISPRLSPGGVLAMTVHEQEADGFGLVMGETYSHSQSHVAAAAGAAGLRIRATERGAMREENKKPLPTLFLVLEKT